MSDYIEEIEKIGVYRHKVSIPILHHVYYFDRSNPVFNEAIAITIKHGTIMLLIVMRLQFYNYLFQF